MNNDEVLLDLDDGVATVTFNRPTKSNVMGLHHSAGFNEVLDRVEADRSVRCPIVTGAGNICNGGGDLHEIMSPDPTDLKEKLKLIRGYNRVVKRLSVLLRPARHWGGERAGRRWRIGHRAGQRFRAGIRDRAL
jgi:enoyl-CoA hydratase/carnithine racemase